MNPAKAAALLNGKVQSFAMGLGGEKVTDQDIAHAFGKIRHDGARALGRLKWAGHSQSYRVLYDTLMGNVVALRIIDDWRDVKAGDLDKLVKLAIHVSINPNLCAECHGIGAVMIEKHKTRGRPRKRRKPAATLKVVCPVCKGNGSIPHSERYLATQGGFGRWRWERTWAFRFHQQVSPILDKYERLFWAGLRRVLRD